MIKNRTEINEIGLDYPPPPPSDSLASIRIHYSPLAPDASAFHFILHLRLLSLFPARINISSYAITNNILILAESPLMINGHRTYPISERSQPPVSPPVQLTSCWIRFISGRVLGRISLCLLRPMIPTNKECGRRNSDVYFQI